MCSRDMDKILHDLKTAHNIVDAQVYGENETGHLQNLNAVLT